MKFRKPIILTFVRYYLPGYKSGGPVRTINNMVEQLGDELDFLIITLDRDETDIQPYSDIDIGVWNTVGKSRVYYVDLAACSFVNIVRLIRKTSHDVIYLNSFFDPFFTIRLLLARYFRLLPKRPWIIATRGEFSKGALAIKRWKKTAFIFLAEKLGLYNDLIWQASSEYEVTDIQRVINSVARKIVIAPDLPTNLNQSTSIIAKVRQPGESLRVIFLSRISPKKNLEFALHVLAKVCSQVSFNIYGPVNEEGYWSHCQQLIADLPAYINVTYYGSIDPVNVPEVMASHDLFFLPTRGENYGHVIAEALIAGTPVLIANTTPWRDLQRAGVGWDLPLDAEQPYVECIDYCARLDAEAYREWRVRVQNFAYQRLSNPEIIEANRVLFIEAIGRKIGIKAEG